MAVLIVLMAPRTERGSGGIPTKPIPLLKKDAIEFMQFSQFSGQEPGPGLLGKIMGEIRRSFSVAVVRSQALCLLERLAQLGPGARAAADRRHQTMALDERRRRERQAFAMANQGRGLCRVGRAFVP